MTDNTTPPEVGCLFDSHHGIHINKMIVDLAREYGWNDDDPNFDDEADGWVEASQDAEEWLNENIAIYPNSFGWYDGDFVYQSQEWWEET